ncbi:Protein Y53C12B.1 [Aphelenchoides avenae]|nr:Protein Y53C12B.1 [Aphelenchus avenae]
MPDIVEFRCSRSLEVFYSGGDVAIDSKGGSLFTACSNVVKAISTEDGSEKFTIGDPEAEDRVTSFCLSHDDSEIVVTYISDLVKRFSLSQQYGHPD